ncbi:MAG: diacylglycerol kinase family protein [Candidatus Bipolaricaulota bacterium]
MNDEKYFLIVNLIAGQGRCKAAFPRVQHALERARIPFDVHYTNEPLEAIDAARMGVEAGFRNIVAMGGDGTINEVANGLVGRAAVLGVIPAGKGNDFARMMGIPSDPVTAARALPRAVEKTVDLGRVGADRHFVNGLGMGIDAQVARDVLAMEHLRGAPAYLYAAVKEVFRFSAFPVHIATASGEQTMNCLSLGVANGKFCGGGFMLAPRAEVADGLIDVAAIGDFPKLERLIRLPQARAGKHLSLSQVRYEQTARATISSEAKLIAHMDGEPYELPKASFDVSIVPGALKVLVPV